MLLWIEVLPDKTLRLMLGAMDGTQQPVVVADRLGGASFDASGTYGYVELVTALRLVATGAESGRAGRRCASGA
jgi:hypothetical protein